MWRGAGLRSSRSCAKATRRSNGCFEPIGPYASFSLGRWGPLLIEDLVGLPAAAVSEIRQHPRKRVVALIAGRG
jgi:hypothetical protein